MWRVVGITYPRRGVTQRLGGEEKEMFYVRIIPTKCDCCGEIAETYSDRSSWFGKYLQIDEDKICHACISGRDGYAEEYLEKIGVLPEATIRQ